MSNRKPTILQTSYDLWIIWSYAIISLVALVAMYGFSKSPEAAMTEGAAALQSLQP